jgi:alpha-L-fucosidase
VHARTAPWVQTETKTVTEAGTFSTTLTNLPREGSYEFRAVVRHPLLAIYGAEVTMRKTAK